MSSKVTVDLQEVLAPREKQLFEANALLSGHSAGEHLRAIAFGEPEPRRVMAGLRAVVTHEETAPRLSSGSRVILEDEPTVEHPPVRGPKRGK